MRWFVDRALGARELARKCEELLGENDRLREQVDGLQAALEMRDALTMHGGLIHRHPMAPGDTLHLQQLPARADLRIRSSNHTELEIRW